MLFKLHKIYLKCLDKLQGWFLNNTTKKKST